MADSNITTETPTANHRPRRTIRFEVELREFVNDRISRGIVEASLEFDPEDPEYWEKRDEYLGYAIAHAMERAFLGGRWRLLILSTTFVLQGGASTAAIANNFTIALTNS
jgi:hypothetical protein